MKGCLGKRLGLNKARQINPKALGVSGCNMSHAITSQGSSLSNQLVWWLEDPRHHTRARETFLLLSRVSLHTLNPYSWQ